MFKLVARMLKHFAILSKIFRRFTYFNDPTKLFLNLYPAKFLDKITKSFHVYNTRQSYERVHRRKQFSYLIDYNGATRIALRAPCWYTRGIALSHGTILREVARWNENTRMEFLAQVRRRKFLTSVCLRVEFCARSQTRTTLRANATLPYKGS